MQSVYISAVCITSNMASSVEAGNFTRIRRPTVPPSPCMSSVIIARPPPRHADQRHHGNNNNSNITLTAAAYNCYSFRMLLCTATAVAREVTE